MRTNPFFISAEIKAKINYNSRLFEIMNGRMNKTNISGDSSSERVPQPLSDASSLFMKFANGNTNGTT